MRPTLRKWLDSHLDAQRRLVEIAVKHQLEHDTRHYEKFYSQNKKVKEVFPPGTYVLCTHPDSGMGRKPKNKLDTPLRGPFQVREYDEYTRQYTLYNLLANRTFRVDPSKVVKFHYDPAVTDPVEVARIDKHAFFVESIRSVRGDPHQLKSLEFEVVWEDQTVEWVPYAVIRDTEACNRFLRESDVPALRNIAVNREKYLSRIRERTADLLSGVREQAF